MRTIVLLSLILAAASPARAASLSWVQNDWSGGAVPGSTTSAAAGWNQYEKDDGEIVVLSTGVQSLHTSYLWTQTDDGAGETGFNRTGSVFSTVAVVGAGAAAELAIVNFETVTIRTASLPLAREQMGSCVDSRRGQVYLFGGINPDGTLSDEILRYNPGTDTLVALSTPLPVPIYGVAASYDGFADKIYIFGGRTSTGAVTAIHGFDPNTDAYLTLGSPTDKLSAPASHMSAVFDPTHAPRRTFLFGGRDAAGTDVSTITAYSATFLRNDVLAITLPTPRSDAAGVFDISKDRIYLFGGNSAGVPQDDIQEIDTTFNFEAILEKSAVLPSSRSAIAAAYHAYSTKTYLYGGSLGPGAAISQIVEYDAVADTLAVRASVLPSSGSHFAAAYDENTAAIYLFGGTGTAGGFDTVLRDFFVTSGTYASSVFDTSNLSNFQTISWGPVDAFDPKVMKGIEFRAGTSSNPPAGWTAWNSVQSGDSIASLGPLRFVQYRSSFTTTDISTSAVLSDLSIAYARTSTRTHLVSSVFDTGGAQNVIQGLSWTGTTPSGTSFQFQIRTATTAALIPGATWFGPTSENDFYTAPVGSGSVNPLQRDGVGDQAMQYRVFLVSTDTLNRPTLSTVTLLYNFRPAQPSDPVVTAVSSAAFRVEWTDNSLIEDFFILRWTENDITVFSSTIPSAGGPSSGTVQVSTITGAEFAPNHEFKVWLAAFDSGESIESIETSKISRATLANPPTEVVFSSVTLSSAGVSFNASNNNDPSTSYLVELTTGDFATAVSTPIAWLPITQGTFSVSGLGAGTTYYLRMKARNNNLIETAFSEIISTATLPAPSAAPAATPLGTSSIAWSWATSGPAARYRVYSTFGGGQVLIGETASLSFTQTGLSTNAVYAAAVEPYTTSGSAGLSLSTTKYTLAALPEPLQLFALGTSSITLLWSRNGGPITTIFEVSTSTDDFQTSVSTPIPFSSNFTPVTTTRTGLDPGTTYYFRVRARNADGLDTEFVRNSTRTVPGGIAGLSGATLGISSIAWSWTNAGGPGVDSFNVFRASGAQLLAVVSTNSYNDTGLEPNTAYGVVVQPVAGAAGPLSSPATNFTLARTPFGTTIAEVLVDSITLTWNTAANPAGTLYEIERSTDGAVFVVRASISTNTYADTDLPADATYYFRVRALNGDLLGTSYDVVVSTFLLGELPLPPSGLKARSIGGARIALSWTISPSENLARYNLYYDSGTGTIDYGVLFASVNAQTTETATIALAAGTTYLFGLRAQNLKQAEENNDHVIAAAVALSTVQALSGAIRSPPSGTTVAGNHLTLTAELVAGSAASVGSVRFQYRPLGLGAWLDAGGLEADYPNPTDGGPWLTHWNTSLLTPGVYELRAVFSDANGAADANPPSSAVRVFTADPDISESVVAAGNPRVIQRVRVRNAAPAALELAQTSSRGMIRISLSSGALNAAATHLKVDNGPPSVPGFGPEFSPTGLAVEISLESGQTELSGGRLLAIRLTDLDKDRDNRVDGTQVRADNLRLASYDASAGKWKADFASAAGPEDAVTLTGRTPHLSLFSAASPAANGLDGVRVYPVPFKPNNGVDNDGKPYTAADPVSGIVFDTLPAGADIAVYTVSGALVWESPADLRGGLFRWDARNGNGVPVASGVYYAVIRRPGGETAVKKLAVIR